MNGIQGVRGLDPLLPMKEVSMQKRNETHAINSADQSVTRIPGSRVSSHAGFLFIMFSFGNHHCILSTVTSTLVVYHRLTMATDTYRIDK